MSNSDNERTRNELSPERDDFYRYTQRYRENRELRSLAIDRPSTSRHHSPTEILRNNFYNIVNTVTETTLTLKKTIPADYYSETDSELEYDYCTPVKKKRLNSGTGGSDSGCATGPSSSTIKSRHRPPECSTFNDHSSDEEDYKNENKFEKFKRHKKARLNIRKRIVNDSDSN